MLPPRSSHTAGQYRRFIARAAVAATASIACVAAFNVWADPLGVVGSGRYRAASVPWLDRTYKVELVRRTSSAPDVVLLGSSTTQQLDPRAIKARTGQAALNLTVADCSPLDAYLLTRFVFQRFDGAPPRIVYGLDVGSMASARPNHAILQNPELRSGLGIWERSVLLVRAYRPIVDLRQVERSAKVVREGPVGSLPPLSAVLERDGRTKARLPDGDSVTPLSRARLRERLGLPTASEATPFTELDRRQVRALEQLVVRANELGITPVIFLPPASAPQARDRASVASRRYWAAWQDRRVELLRLLDRLRSSHELVVLDLTDPATAGIDRSRFIDHLHLDAQGTGLLTDHLLDAEAFG